MTLLRFLFLGCFFILFFCRSAAGLEYLTGRSTAIGGTFLLSNPSSSEMVELPVSHMRTGEWQIESGYHRQFELSELDQVYVAGSGRWKSVSLAVGLSQFGESGLFTEKILKTSAAYHLRRFAIGASVSGMITEIGNSPGNFRSSGFGLSGLYRSPRLLVALAIDDLNSPAPFEGGVELGPRYSGYLEFLGTGAYSLTAKLALQDKESPRLGFGQRINLSPRSLFYWGVQSEPLMYGGGLELGVGSGSISYGTMIHPVLGFTHTFGFSFGWGQEQRKKGKRFD